MRMPAVAGAGIDLEMREMLHHRFGGAQGRVHIINRQQEDFGGVCLSCAEQFEPRSIAVVDLAAEFAHKVDLGRAAVEGDEANAPRGKDAADDLPETAKACDDHLTFVRRCYVVGLGEFGHEAACHPIARELKDRRCRHRQTDDQHQELLRVLTNDLSRDGGREDHEGEISALGYGHGEAAL